MNRNVRRQPNLTSDKETAAAVEALREGTSQAGARRASKGQRRQIIAVGGPCRGSGTSTIVHHLAYLDAHLGYRVLVIDADPQGSMSYLCGERWRLGVEPRLEYVHMLVSTPVSRFLRASRGDNNRVELTAERLLELANRYDRIYIDADGDCPDTLSLLRSCANLHIIPFRPTGNHIRVLQSAPCLKLPAGPGLEQVLVPTMVPVEIGSIARTLLDLETAIERFKSGDVKLSKVWLTENAAVGRPLSVGATVFEDMDEKASCTHDRAMSEFSGLYQSLFGEPPF